MFTTQKYQFVAEDLQDKGHLGEGAFGTVSKMVFNKTKTLMAVKVNTVDLHNSCSVSYIVMISEITRRGADVHGVGK